MKISNIDFKKVLLVVFAIGILFLAFKCHNSDTNLATAELQHKQKIENANNIINELAHQNADVENEKSKIKNENSKLISDNILLKNSYSNLTRSVKIQTDKVKRYSRSDIELYYDNRYNMPNDVKSTANGTELTDTIAKLNITDLVMGDGAKSKLKITQSILFNTEKQVKDKDSLWHLTEKQLSNSNLILSQKDTIIETQKEQVKDIEKQFKSERLKKNLWKIGTLGAAAVILKLILIK